MTLHRQPTRLRNAYDISHVRWIPRKSWHRSLPSSRNYFEDLPELTDGLHQNPAIIFSLFLLLFFFAFFFFFFFFFLFSFFFRLRNRHRN